MNVRDERAGDAAAIRAVHVASFPTAEEAGIVDALRNAGVLHPSLVAEVDDEVVGHVAFSPVTLDGAPAGLGLGPVAVLPDHRKQGIGAALINEGLAACELDRCDWVVVLGDPAYYGRFGFVPASAHGLSDTFGGGDAFQVIEIMPGALPEAGGTVRYRREFG